MKTQFSKTLTLLFVSLFVFQTSCATKDELSNGNTNNYNAEVANKWYAKMLEITPQTSGFSANVVARAMAYTGVALYESVVVGMPEYQSLSGKLNGFEHSNYTDPNFDYYLPAAANAAMAYMVKNMYANMSAQNLASIDALESEINASFTGQADLATLTRSKNFGKKIAEDVFEWSKTDGADQAYLHLSDPNFVPISGPGRWRLTTPTATPLHPYWGNNRPFIAENITGSQPSAPKTYSTASNSAFYIQANEVYNTTQTLTNEQKTIAYYWADEMGSITAPGHSISILMGILEGENANLATAAEAYCKLGIGLNDAYISCWKCKYQHSLLRPVSYIKEVINPAWTPLINTPASPEYTSEQAIQAGVTGNILSNLFGENYTFSDFTHQNRTDIDGSARNFISFDDATHESAFAGLYGGTHFRDAIIIGITQGKIIGGNINAMPFKK